MHKVILHKNAANFYKDANEKLKRRLAEAIDSISENSYFNGHTKKLQCRQKKRIIPSKAAHLENLIAEATVDCYNESEEITGIFTVMKENLEMPFKTTILGVGVTVDRIDMNEAG